MNRCKIPHTHLEISRLAFGGNVLGWTLDEKASFEILDAFAAGGGNFIDTADTYAWWVNGTGGQSETIIGNWMKLRGNRKEMIIATKTGSETREHGFDISKKHILQSVEESLRRLQTDYIDLYYTHFDDLTTPEAETLSAYQEMIQAGKVRYIAASNLSPERLEQSFAVAQKQGLPEYVALQPHYNLVEREKYEQAYLPLVEKYQLTVFPYWALAAGFLTGKYRSEADFSKSIRGKNAEKYLNQQGLAILDALDQVAEKHHTRPATVSLAWLLAQPHIGAPIASATNTHQLETLLAAPALQLDAEDLEFLDRVSK
ncbi:aldo/keto reductase [Niabella terrae]